MGWGLGYDTEWYRDIGYGVPAYCDHPDCNKEIDRGLAYVCGSLPYGGRRGCGLYFCEEHRNYHPRLKVELCPRCGKKHSPYKPKPEHPDWLNHKLNHESWEQWRQENPGEAERIRNQLETSSTGIQKETN